MGLNFFGILSLFTVFIGLVSTAHADSWAQHQREIAIGKMLLNISPGEAARGAVVASPSKSEPNYFRHWIRDAALTMNLVVSLYENSTGEERAAHYRRMMDYVDFSRRNQLTPNPSGGLGEPLFLANGEPFNQGWGRPQNDSPALRAMVLARWAQILLNEGQESLVREKLYESRLPAETVIKADLEYVSHNWTEASFDLWEEVKGDHFYTRMVQRKALLEGAKLADRLGDGGAASWYREQGEAVGRAIQKHWHHDGKFLQTTLNRVGGADYKHSNLDTSTILGVLHGDTFDGFFPLYDDRALSTAEILIERFRSLFRINGEGPGVAMGRYPEDHYDGNGFSEGNPWVLLTAAMGEFHFRVAKGLRAVGEISINDTNAAFFRAVWPGNDDLKPGFKTKAGSDTFRGLLQRLAGRGNDFMLRVKRHTGDDGQMSEQMNRHTGFMQGARDLTWSYAAFIVASWEQEGAKAQDEETLALLATDLSIK